MQLKSIILMVVLVWAMSALHAQSSSRIQTAPNGPSNYQWYKVSFEIKHVSHPDSNLVNTIPLKMYESQRLTSSPVEIFDPVSGYTLILYSDEKCRINKSHHHHQPK